MIYHLDLIMIFMGIELAKALTTFININMLKLTSSLIKNSKV